MRLGEKDSSISEILTATNCHLHSSSDTKEEENYMMQLRQMMIYCGPNSSEMKFPSFGKKYKCMICGEKFKTGAELEDYRVKMQATSTA